MLRCGTSLLLLFCISWHALAWSNNTLTIVSWNLQWMSLKQDKVIREPRDYQKFSQLITDLNPDIFAFQEVDSIEAIYKILPNSSYDVLLSGRDAPNSGRSQQYTGFAVRNTLSYTVKPALTSLAPNQRLRYGTVITLSGRRGTPLTIMNVHLKSGCFEEFNHKIENKGKRKSCVTLSEQFSSLKEWVSAHSDSQGHYMVIGDFNHRLATSKSYHQWASFDASPTLVTGKLNASCYAKNRRGGYNRYDELIDHAITDPALAAAIQTRGSVMQIQLSLKELKQFTLSDHCPIMIRVPYAEF
ncbi:endonuclease/exonuclease/phosphatase family protein [Thaumasiovibrio sp. DFM-14]|uniref:endonuclease/exonuclease/phosphatase family protein n=1 Tax=Thaumasiovibrio sp. DFM-14 TaxID=3384792 RepID=UPI0039A0D841